MYTVQYDMCTSNCFQQQYCEFLPLTDNIITNICFLLVWRIGEKDDNSYHSNSSRPHSPVPSSHSSHPLSHPTSSTPPSPIQQRSASLSSFSSSSSDEDIQVQDFNVFLIQGYPQRMKLQRRLYVIYFVHFRAFRVLVDTGLFISLII